MEQTRIRIYHIDGDTLEVLFEFQEPCGAWIGDYPYFEDEPRHTPAGRPWKNVTHDGCLHAQHRMRDCGTCPHLKREQQTDLIGVCYHEKMRLRE